MVEGPLVFELVGVGNEIDGAAEAGGLFFNFVVDMGEVGAVGESVDDGGGVGEAEMVEIAAFDGGFGGIAEAEFGDEDEEGVKLEADGGGVVLRGDLEDDAVAGAEVD